MVVNLEKLNDFFKKQISFTFGRKFKIPKATYSKIFDDGDIREISETFLISLKNKMCDSCNEYGKKVISRKKARYILGMHYNVPKKMYNDVLFFMEKKGYIKRINQDCLEVL